ncbi:pirin family protein [uncultured Maribacter sp.]|uniref:pirin family protein n=1 Tax=uncultured Maribacter sp. TaxID=431308 RepID=UPI0030D78290|tara:strand:+ start:7024 stop:7737 length:714 start_codon:yes stop_codon:yes gene_type:complete
MKTILHKSDTRGHADHGWLNSYHSFSFANFHNPERMNFGVLRVLNDDVVAAGRGFGTHPHSNMEIISIPLEGDLQHMDDMGNSTVIKSGDVQVMSAGTGVSHSEHNKNKNELVKFLQIWVIPNKRDVTPRYDQISIKNIETKNSLFQILSPNEDDYGVWIHQDAWFHLGDYESGETDSYSIKKEGNGVYIFVLEGEIVVNDQVLNKRDGYGIWETDSFTLSTNSDAKILVMEVPMSN